MGQHAAAAVSSVRSPVSGRSVCSVGSSGSPPASVPPRSPGSSQRPPAARFRPVRCSASSRPFQVERILILKTPASASSHPCLLVFFLCFLKCIFSVPHGALVLRVAPLNISAPPGAAAAPSFTPSLSARNLIPAHGFGDIHALGTVTSVSSRGRPFSGAPKNESDCLVDSSSAQVCFST